MILEVVPAELLPARRVMVGSVVIRGRSRPQLSEIVGDVCTQLQLKESPAATPETPEKCYKV